MEKPNLSGVNVSIGSPVVLTWNKVKGAAKYCVKRDSQKIGIVGGKWWQWHSRNPRFKDKDAGSGTHKYMVTPLGSDCEPGPDSNELEITVSNVPEKNRTAGSPMPLSVAYLLCMLCVGIIIGAMCMPLWHMVKDWSTRSAAEAQAKAKADEDQARQAKDRDAAIARLNSTVEQLQTTLASRSTSSAPATQPAAAASNANSSPAIATTAMTSIPTQAPAAKPGVQYVNGDANNPVWADLDKDLGWSPAGYVWVIKIKDVSPDPEEIRVDGEVRVHLKDEPPVVAVTNITEKPIGVQVDSNQLYKNVREVSAQKGATSLDVKLGDTRLSALAKMRYGDIGFDNKSIGGVEIRKEVYFSVWLEKVSK